MGSTVNLVKTSSKLVREAQELCYAWLDNIDKHIADNINKITCSDIKEIYYSSLFGELKRWRSCSSGFTGFSEYLVFRALYHIIGETFTALETGDIATDPIVFRSKNYEIGQSVKIKLDGNKRSPDIYVKRDGNLISIIQIKLVTGGGKSQITEEVETFKLFKKFYPEVKGLFIVFIKESFTKEKEQKLRTVGYQTLILENNKTSISSILKQFI